MEQEKEKVYKLIFTDIIKKIANGKNGRTKYISIPAFALKKTDLKPGDTVLVTIKKIEIE